ncbi:MAG: O-antigen ligase domain-containing protein [Leptolyngbya sp. BL-A-14]
MTKVLPIQGSTTAAQLFFKPAVAWAGILGLIVITTLLILAGAGKFLNILFPLASLLLGVLLYYRAPSLYIACTWWLWFLAPFVRRISDYRSSFTDPSPILLAPFLMTSVSVITLWKYFPKAHRGGGTPFLLAIVGLIYGVLIGLINKSPFAAAKDFLDWTTPVFFGFHLFTHWQQYPAHRKTMERVFTWAILGMGIYGIFQFISLPAWDDQWLTNSQLESAIVESQNDSTQKTVRVWATMQSGEPFSAFMAGGLLLLLISKGPLPLPASIVGYLSFLLAMVRSGWLGWAAGALTLVSSLRPKFQVRLVLLMLALGLCLVPLANMEPFATSINERLNSFSNVEDDASAQSRQASNAAFAARAMTSVIGDGLGGGSIDSAIFATLFNLGWLGTLPYMGSILILIWKLFQNSPGTRDPFVGVARAIVITVVIRMPLNGSNTGASGLLLWTFLALGLAAIRYHQWNLQGRLNDPVTPPGSSL